MVDFAYVSANRCISGLKEEGQLKRENCDVLVIGSGIGGLSAAAFLVASGYKTLVVERLPRIGGRYSTIERRGYKITTGAIEVEMGGVVEQAFNAVGARLDVRPVPPIRYRIDGKDHELPPKGGLNATAGTRSSWARTPPMRDAWAERPTRLRRPHSWASRAQWRGNSGPRG